MKNLSLLARNFLGHLPEFSAEEKATHVWNRGTFQSLKIPTLHAEISCPMCGRYDGYRVIDGNIKEFCGWSCREDQCIDSFEKRSVFIRRKPSLANCGVPERLVDANFAEIQQDLEITAKLKEFCETYRGFLLLPGSSGTGKSYASVCCMGKYLEKKEDCFFVNVADLFVTWLGLKQTGHSELHLLEKYGECELLILDDVGTRAPSEAFLDFLYLLINKRSGKTSVGTIISTNLGYQDLAQKLGDAILSRISSGLIAKFTGKDRRKPKF